MFILLCGIVNNSELVISNNISNHLAGSIYLLQFSYQQTAFFFISVKLK